MLEAIITSILECDKELEKNSSVILLATFLISYLVFNVLFKSNRSNQSESISRQKQKIAQDYLKKHEKEDRAFFIGEYDDSSDSSF